MIVCKHLSGGFLFNFHLAVLPFPLRLLLVRLGQLRGQSARGDAWSRLAVAKILEQGCVLIVCFFQRSAFPESVIGVVSVVASSVAFAVHCKPRFVTEVLVPQTS